jgi:hypothetical protein
VAIVCHPDDFDTIRVFLNQLRVNNSPICTFKGIEVTQKANPIPATASFEKDPHDPSELIFKYGFKADNNTFVTLQDPVRVKRSYVFSAPPCQHKLDDGNPCGNHSLVKGKHIIPPFEVDYFCRHHRSRLIEQPSVLFTQ